MLRMCVCVRAAWLNHVRVKKEAQGGDLEDKLEEYGVELV